MAEASDLEAILQQRLRHSRHRFQRSMRLLIAKYDQPFEDAPLVEMTTLTYQTAQGLRVWGGRLIEEESAQHSQVEGTPLTPVSQGDSPQRAAHTDSKSDDLNATFDWKDEAAMAMALTPPVPQSPPIDELRRKYLTQVDILLQDDKRSEQVDDRVGEDILVTLGSVSVKPTLGDDRGVCARNTWSPDNPAPSLREGDLSTAWEVVPGNDSLVSHGVSSHSFSSCQSFEARNICDVTISDLYEGMLLSMSRLLAKQPSCIISTKTVLTQDWRWRRRARGKGRLGWTYCGRNRAANWASGRRRSPPSQPDGAPHRPKDLLCGSGHGTALQLKSPLQEANTLRAHDSAPHREDLTVTPRKSSWSRHLSFIVDHDLDQEDRIMTLNWLISPVKLKSRPTTLQCLVETRHSEIEFKFDKLYQKCCPDPSTLPGPVGPWAVDVYRGDRTNPGCLRGSRRLSLPEGLGKPQKGSIRGGECLPKRGPSLTDPAQHPGHWEPAVDSVLQRSNPGAHKWSLPPAKALSPPSIHLGQKSSHYSGIKERFDRFHQDSCPATGLQTVEWSSDRAVMDSPYKKSFQGKRVADTDCRSPQKPLFSPQWSIRSPPGPTAGQSHPWKGVPHAHRLDHLSPAKRRRLSDPVVSGQWIRSWDPACVCRATPTPRPGTQTLQRDREEKEERTQDGKVIFCSRKKSLK